MISTLTSKKTKAFVVMLNYLEPICLREIEILEALQREIQTTLTVYSARIEAINNRLLAGVGYDGVEPARARAALSASSLAQPIMSYRATATGHTYWLSDSMLAWLGATNEDVVGRGWVEFVHPEDVARLHAAPVTDRMRSYTKELRVRRHDGVYRMLSITIVPDLSPRGEYLGKVGMAVELTPQ